jgi:4-amino-4-deoxy-L-arabinose transferase-like glycosyltransferase
MKWTAASETAAALPSAPWAPRTAQGQGLARDLATMTLLVLAWLASTAWARPLMLPDEGRYVAVAWEMLQSGQWSTPLLNGLPFFHKPPLFYWITAASLKLFGMGEWPARAAPLLGAALGALSLYAFTCRWLGRALARRVLVVLAVQPLFLIGGQFANLDMLVAGLIVATVLALAHVVLSQERGLPAEGMLVLAHALAALGVLAKGLIGLVLPALAIGSWLLLRGRGRHLPRLLSLPGMGVFVVLAVPWFVVMQQRFDGFFHYFFVVQHLQRFAATGFNNVQPWWFYPAVLMLLSLPGLWWSSALLRRAYWHAGGDGLLSSVRLLMALGAGCVLVFFSLPQSKLIGYILPAVPPLAWLMADASLGAAGEKGGGRQRAWWACMGLSAVLGLAAVAGLAIARPHSTRDIGLALHALRHPGEPVYMLDGYWYDVPFYARLREPVTLVGNWQDPDIATHDNWRKEIKDAADFSPQQGRWLLPLPAELPARLCRAGVSWVVGDQHAVRDHAFLPAHPAAREGTAALWRVDSRRPEVAAALGCSPSP